MTQQTRGDNVSPEKEVGGLQEIARKAALEYVNRHIVTSNMEPIVNKIEPIILYALQSVAQPLEEERDQWKRRAIENENGCNILEKKVASLQKDLDWTRDNATEHCHRADTAEAAVGGNCKTIEKLEALLKTAQDNCKLHEEDTLKFYHKSVKLADEKFALQTRIQELEARP